MDRRAAAAWGDSLTPPFAANLQHLNNDGSVLVARKVKDFLDAKGW